MGIQVQGYILKHLKYINYRIDTIAPYVNKDDEQNDPLSIFPIIRYLSNGETLPAFPAGNIHQSLIELKNLVHRWDINNEGDILGYIYQQLKSTQSKKKQGQFFTPPDIVSFIIKKTFPADIDPFNIKILDPACGSGQFLIAAFNFLSELYIRRGVPFEKAAVSILSKNIFGFDIDPVAVYITHYNLMRITAIKDYKKYNIHLHDYIFSQPKDNPAGTTRFDIVIGNPPWGSALESYQKQTARQFYVSSESGINTFTLFIEKSFSMLNDHGVIGFLIPEAYLNIKAHSASRSFMLHHACIKNIAVWGERFKGVFAPSISLVAQKTPSAGIRSRNIVTVQHPLEKNSETATLIPQQHYLTTHHHIFNIHYSRRAVQLLTKIDEQDCFYLSQKAQFYLGIVTGNNPQYLSTTKSENHPDPILKGKDVQQYTIEFSGTYFKYDSRVLQQVAPREYYEHKCKLLYKFIGRQLVFALDRSGMFSLNNINGLIPMNIPITPECLVALLNSRVLQYYYEKNFFTVKVLRGNLEKLPIKAIKQGTQKKLHRLSQELMYGTPDLNNTIMRETIEDMICFEYGIPDRAAVMIENVKRLQDAVNRCSDVKG